MNTIATTLPALQTGLLNKIARMSIADMALFGILVVCAIIVLFTLTVTIKRLMSRKAIASAELPDFGDLDFYDETTGEALTADGKTVDLNIIEETKPKKRAKKKQNEETPTETAFHIKEKTGKKSKKNNVSTLIKQLEDENLEETIIKPVIEEQDDYIDDPWDEDYMTEDDDWEIGGEKL